MAKKKISADTVALVAAQLTKADTALVAAAITGRTGVSLKANGVQEAYEKNLAWLYRHHDVSE